MDARVLDEKRRLKRAVLDEKRRLAFVSSYEKQVLCDKFYFGKVAKCHFSEVEVIEKLRRKWYNCVVFSH